MKKNLKNLLKYFILAFTFTICLSSCQNDESEKNLENSDELQDIISRQFSLEQIPHFNQVSEKLHTLNSNLNTENDLQNRTVDTSNVSILTDDILFMEYAETHTYTFKLLRDNPLHYIENIILHYNVDSQDYDEYLVQYNISFEQYQDVVNGLPLDETAEVEIFELDNGTLVSLLGRSSCFRTCQTITALCTAGGSHSPNDPECCANDGTCSSDQGGFVYQSCGITCFDGSPPPVTEEPDPIQGGGGTGNGTVVTNPIPTIPCQGSSGEIDDNGNCIDVTAYELSLALEDDPFLLLEIDCNQIQNWQTLAQHTAPQSIQNKINNLPSSLTNDFEIQSLSDAGGTMVNLDYFSVSVTNLPNNPSTNTQFTADEFLDYMRHNFNDFVEGSTFEPYCEITSMCQTETDLWNSNNPSGSIIYIDIPLDDGVVVCTEYTSNYWYFMTMNAPYAGNHPVSGTRQFGYEQNLDGSFSFFVRGVDRFDSNIAENVAYATQFGNAFQGADNLWESFQNKTQQFINDNGGSSSIVTPVKNRPDWDKVQKVLNGERPISDLGCN